MGRAVFATLWASVREYRGRVLAALGLLVIAKVATVAVPVVLKRIVDALGRPEQILVLPAFLLLAYALLRFAGTLFGEIRDLVFVRVSRETVGGYIQRAFGHLHSLGARFHAQRQTGAVTRDVERGTTGIGFLLGVGLFTVVPTLVEIFLVMGIMMGNYSDWFTAIIGVTFVVYGVFTVLFTARRAIHQRQLNELDSRAHGYIVDSLLNHETVKLYANEGLETTRLQRVMREWIGAGIQNQKALSTLHVGQSAIIAFGVGSIMLLAGQEVVNRTMTVGDLILINAFVIQICLPLNALGFVFREARDALVNVEKMFHLLQQKPEIVDPADGKKLQVSGGEIVFEHVNFEYESNRPILQDVDFRIPAGATVAVVGGSGSGKSTLARLLLRLYDVQGGRVAIDGQDIRHVTTKSLREAIGVVPQDTTLFNDTIAYNIGYGRPGASLAEIIEAARTAQVHDFIASLPEQYDTMVGERGVKLSGGERQRIAIARAVLKNPPVMIFDEATSALDARSERAIQAELDRIAKNRSTLVIAHRLSTIVAADLILVMERGRIMERGRHDELLARQGLYAQMWALQQQERELERTERRLALQPVNLVILLADVVDALRGEIDARRINLYTTMATTNARVTGDPTLLQRLFGDLCAYAVASSPEGSRLELEVKRTEGNVSVRLVDMVEAAESGSLSNLEAIPDFTNLQHIAQQHRGRLTIERLPHGKGTVYAVELPLRAVADPERRPAPGPATTPAIAVPPAASQIDPSIAGMSIVVVDDQDDAREVLADTLEMHGAQVNAFGRGTDAVQWFEQTPHARWPDLLICDIGLPDRDGYSVVRAIRAAEAQQSVDLRERMPAIALTGYAESSDRMRALLAGFQLHLSKPVSAPELLASVASFGRTVRSTT
jgi:ATP-binding cassette subfamily B protein